MRFNTWSEGNVGSPAVWMNSSFDEMDFFNVGQASQETSIGATEANRPIPTDLKRTARRVFATQIKFGDNRPYAVDKSGQRILLKVAPDPRLIAVTDWRALLRR